MQAPAPAVPDPDLDEHQREAVRLATGPRRVCVVTGRPGTGKSTIVKCVVRELKRQGERVVLLGPTGKATQVLLFIVGAEARVATVARLLCSATMIETFRGGTVLMDEASMISNEMAYDVLRTLAPRRLILVGDEKQRQPVVGQSFLRALLFCQAVPRVRLSRVWRQQGDTALKRNLDLLEANVALTRDQFDVSDDTFAWTTGDDAAIRELVSRAEGRPHFLCATNEDVRKCNDVVRSVLNQLGRQLEGRYREFRVGDVVMCTDNLSRGDTLVVPNGAFGVITCDRDVASIDYDVVDEEGRRAVYRDTFENRRFETRFALAYATTIDKFQGSETDTVVVIVNGKWVTRELLYTGISRAKRRCCVAVSDESLARATAPDVYVPTRVALAIDAWRPPRAD